MGGSFGWLAATALTLGLAWTAAGRAAEATSEASTGGAPQPAVLRCSKAWTGDAPVYVRQVAYYVADLKPSFAGNKFFKPDTALTEDNYRAVLDGLKRYAGVNGVRLPIFPDKDATQYGKIYGEVLAHARDLGLLVYANPSAVGQEPFRVRGREWTNDEYASWLADYAREFRPAVLSPFNEAARGSADMVAIVKLLRDKLKADQATAAIQLMGPDDEHVEYTLDALKGGKSRASSDPGDSSGRSDPKAGSDLLRSFDMIGSHNAGSDEQDTKEKWGQLVTIADGRPTWSSESPVSWKREKREQGKDGGERTVQLGMDQAVEGGVSGIVSWMAKPGLVDGSGNPTLKACEIAAGLLK